MKTAWYVGDHKDDGIMARLGYKTIRLGQVFEEYGQFTHCEAILMGPWWSATIAGASLRDDAQVRIKTVDLTPGNWRIWDTPSIDDVAAADWFEANAGKPYSMIGAASSASLLVRFALWAAKVDKLTLGQWCSRALGESARMSGAADMSVSELAAAIMSRPDTVDITDAYFSTPRPENMNA